MDDDRFGGLHRRAIGCWCAPDPDWQGLLAAAVVAAVAVLGVVVP